MTGPRLTITPELGTLEHYGVLGMKWGKTRAKGDSIDISAARNRVRRQNRDLVKAKKSAQRIKNTEARKAALDKLGEMKMAALKNPDRVLATRLTTGEKVVAAIFLTPVGAAAVIGGTSATSRRIERKQETGAYNR
jgi:hypothetical protein